MERRRYEREASRKRRQKRQRRLALYMSGILLGAACMAGVVWFVAGENRWMLQVQDSVPAETQDWGYADAWSGRSDGLESVSASEEQGTGMEVAGRLKRSVQQKCVLKELGTGEIRRSAVAGSGLSGITYKDYDSSSGS